MRLLFMADFSELFPNRILRGIRKYSQDSGKPWVVSKMQSVSGDMDNFSTLLAWARKWQADVVLAPFNPGDDIAAFRKNGIIAIAVDNVSPFDGIPNLTANYEKMGRMAATRYIARGYRNFGFFGYKQICWSDRRRKGFMECLEDRAKGASYHEFTRDRTGTVWNYDEKTLCNWLSSLPKPIGILACDDNQANILLECCLAIGIKVPEEVAVIGVDNDEILCTMTEPQLSSIDVDMEAGGYALAKMAERMVREPEYAGEDIVLEPINVVIRRSSSIMVTQDSQVQEAITFIAQNAERKIQVRDVLERVPMSRRSLEQHFLKETGLSVYEFITRVRIDIFAQKLLSSSDTVSAIAAQMDEPDAKNLSRRFLSVKGCTPTEYRRKHLRKLGV